MQDESLVPNDDAGFHFLGQPLAVVPPGDVVDGGIRRHLSKVRIEMICKYFVVVFNFCKLPPRTRSKRRPPAECCLQAGSANT